MGLFDFFAELADDISLFAEETIQFHRDMKELRSDFKKDKFRIEAAPIEPFLLAHLSVAPFSFNGISITRILK